MKIKYSALPVYLLIIGLLLVTSACEKETLHVVDFPVGTTVRSLSIKGFNLTDDVFVKLGEKSIQVANCNSKNSINIAGSGALQIPFAPGQSEVEVKFTDASGAVLNSLSFKNDADLFIKFLKTANGVEYNPVIPTPASGKMGLKLQFKSTLQPNFQGNVDINFYYVNKSMGATTTLYKTFTNIPSTSFSNLLELEAPPLATRGNGYAFTIVPSGTTQAFSSVKSVVYFRANYTSFKTITDSDVGYEVASIENSIN